MICPPFVDLLIFGHGILLKFRHSSCNAVTTGAMHNRCFSSQYYELCIFCGAAGYGLLIHAVSISHSDTPHSVELLCTRDQPDAETSTWQQSTQTVIHAPGGTWTHNISRRKAADLRFRPRGHWDRLTKYLVELELKEIDLTLWMSLCLNMKKTVILDNVVVKDWVLGLYLLTHWRLTSYRTANL